MKKGDKTPRLAGGHQEERPHRWCAGRRCRSRSSRRRPTGLRRSAGAQPESSTASTAATMARWMKRSIFLMSLRGIHSEPGPDRRRPSRPTGTCPATLAGLSDNVEGLDISDPRVTFDQLFPHMWIRLPPRGRRSPCPSLPRAALRISPIPALLRALDGPQHAFVTPLKSGRLLLFNVVDGVLDGANLLGGVFWDLNAERPLRRPSRVRRYRGCLRTKVVDEGGFQRYLALFDTKVFHDDFLNLVGDLAHYLFQSCQPVHSG